jgi:2-polyprenyl-3-methyl-5-hydroxy-6-metoxy-1,4-benzoquinol methylase
MIRTARYDQVAEFYVDEVGDRLDDAGTAGLLGLVGDVEGRRVLDAACGQGRVSRELARRSAVVTGIDLSAELVQRAAAVEGKQRLGIDYRVADVSAPDVLAGSVFDGVTCNFGLSDIDDLDGVLRTVRRVLRPGGFLVLSLLHPCFPGWRDIASSAWPPGEGYFQEGWWRTEVRSSRIRRAVGANHRTLSTYLNALVGNGLPVQTAAEPPPPADWLTAGPGTDPVPTFLVLRCRAEG